MAKLNRKLLVYRLVTIFLWLGIFLMVALSVLPQMPRTMDLIVFAHNLFVSNAFGLPFTLWYYMPLLPVVYVYWYSVNHDRTYAKSKWRVYIFLAIQIAAPIMFLLLGS